MQLKMTLQALAGAALMCSSVGAPAQIYVLINDAGKTIIVGPGEKDPESFILQKMVGREGKNWRMERVESRKGCLARRSITTPGKPLRWAVAFAPTQHEAEKAAIDQARALTGANKNTPGNWEKGYCNIGTAKARAIDVPAIEREFRKGR